MNSLYGKFGEKEVIEIITTKDKKFKNLVSLETLNYFGLKKVKIERKKFWSNVVWSLFITARARWYMRKLMSYIIQKGLKIYYVDTDCFFVEGNIDKIKNLVGEKIGQFKLEKRAKKIEIWGKKLYIFGKDAKAKGIRGGINKIKEFIEKGETKIRKFVRFRESLRQKNVKFGEIIKIKKKNIKNVRPSCN
jgi:UDP-2,3-diacylglucosamine pyrophosphatase LpxH